MSSEATRLAAWCEERARLFDARAFERGRWRLDDGSRQCTSEVRFNRDAEEAADNLRAIAVLLRTLENANMG